MCFSHGQESGPWGTKITALAPLAEQAGWQVESLDYRDLADPAARIGRLRSWCEYQTLPIVLAGSSMGAAVVAAAAFADFAPPVLSLAAYTFGSAATTAARLSFT